MNDREAMKLALKALENSKRTHYYCEDTWYSCPKHEEGCADEWQGNECNCGADKVNVQIESAITALRTVLAAAEKEAQMIRDGWRKCAEGQRTTQYCGLLDAAVKAERAVKLVLQYYGDPV